MNNTAGNATAGNDTSSGNSSAISLPPSLDLPPHLSAQKYFFVCTLTVAAWDVLVLTPRTWRLMKQQGWPLLKLIYYFLRLYVPAEFTIVGAYADHCALDQLLNVRRRCRILRHRVVAGGTWYRPRLPAGAVANRLYSNARSSSSSSPSALPSCLLSRPSSMSTASTPYTRRAGLFSMVWAASTPYRSS